jgi:hypothetical protein
MIEIDGPTQVFAARVKTGAELLKIFTLLALSLISLPCLAQTLTPMPPGNVPTRAAEPQQPSNEPPEETPVIASDLTKEFVGLAQDALDSLDRLSSALEFSRINWETADLGSQAFIQKADRAAKTKGQKYIADSLRDSRKSMQDCRSEAEEMIGEHADSKAYAMHQGLCIFIAYSRKTRIAELLSGKNAKKKTPTKAPGAKSNKPKPLN